MTDEKELTEGERILEIIRKAEEKDIVVFWALDELAGMDLDTMISQPTEGLLYDLNRDKATCATFIKKDGATGTWVNSYASALVIARLKERLAATECYILRTVDPMDLTVEDAEIYEKLKDNYEQPST